MDERLDDEARRESRASGFTLLECLWATVLFSVLAIGLIALAGQTMRAHRLILDSRIGMLRVWNDATDFQSGPAEGEAFAPIPGRRPLHRRIIRDGRGQEWEVLRAGK